MLGLAGLLRLYSSRYSLPTFFWGQGTRCNRALKTQDGFRYNGRDHDLLDLLGTMSAMGCSVIVAGRKSLVVVAAASLVWLFCGCRTERPDSCAGVTAPTIIPAATAPGSSLVLNVKDFQAAGDATTDDTSAFSNALNKLAENKGGTLLIPSGTYLVGDLKIGSGTWVKGTGDPLPILVKKRGANSILAIASDPVGGVRPLVRNVSIERLTLHGRSVEDGFSEHTHNLYAVGIQQLTVHQVRFEAFQGDGLYVGPRMAENEKPAHNSDVKVTDNTFDGTNYQNRNGISVVDCTRCLLERNVFSHVSRADMPGAIDIEPDHRDEIVRDITIRKNTINDGHGNPGGLVISLNYKNFCEMPARITVEKNHIQNVNVGITLVWLGAPAKAESPGLRSVVRHNVVKQVDRGFILNGVEGLTVEDNDFSATRNGGQIGVDLGAANVTFRKNNFKGLGTESGSGVMLYGPVTNVSFEGNDFTDLGSGTKQGSAIYFARGVTREIRFTSNRFSSPQHLMRSAIDADESVSFNADTNTWRQNVLNDGIKPGTFPHQ